MTLHHTKIKSDSLCCFTKPWLTTPALSSSLSLHTQHPTAFSVLQTYRTQSCSRVSALTAPSTWMIFSVELYLAGLLVSPMRQGLNVTLEKSSLTTQFKAANQLLPLCNAHYNVIWMGWLTDWLAGSLHQKVGCGKAETLSAGSRSFSSPSACSSEVWAFQIYRLSPLLIADVSHPQDSLSFIDGFSPCLSLPLLPALPSLSVMAYLGDLATSLAS